MRCALWLAAAVALAPVAAYAAEKVPAKPSITRPVDMGRSVTVSIPAGFVMTGPEDAKCAQDSEGALRYSVKFKTLLLCDGAAWRAVATTPLPALQ